MVSKRHGFTVVELLVVIVVIGILAGLAMVGFKGVQDKAIQTEVKADASQIADSLELYYLKNKAFPTDLASLGQVDKSNNTSVSYDSNTTSYCLTTFNTKPGIKSFTARDDSSVYEGDCSGWVGGTGNTNTEAGGGGGGSTPPPPPAPTLPAPSAPSLTFTGPTRVKLSTGEYAQRYVITASGGTCSVGTTEWKMGATGGSSFYNGWAWQTSNVKNADVLENGIYSPTDVNIYARPSCVSGTDRTEGSTAVRYYGNGGGSGGSI